MKNIEEKLLKFTTKKQESLLTKYKKINALEDMFQFWIKNFNLEYFLYLENNLREVINWLRLFEINVTSENDISKYNKLYCLHFKSNHQDKLLNYDDLVSNLEKSIKNIPVKEEFIKSELLKINKAIETKINGTLHQHCIFKSAYEAYLFYGKKLEYLDNEMILINDPIYFNEGYVLAKYKVFLENYFKPKNKRTISIQLSTRQKIILFNRLGFYSLFDKDENLQHLSNKQRAELLALLFGNDGNENIRKDLSDLLSIENYENMSIINQILEKYDLEKN